MRRQPVGALVAFVALIALASCGGGAGGGATSGVGVVSAPQPTPLPSSTVTMSAGPQIVGYWSDWQQTSWSLVPQGVTTLIYSFDFVSGHSVIDDGNAPGYVTPAAIATLHQRGIKVLLSLGGGSPATAFVFDGDTKDFETNLISVLQQYGYDGVDFDDESGTQATRVATLETLIPATRAAFNAAGLSNEIITLAAFDTPSSFGDDTLLAAPGVLSSLSWVNVMSYYYNVAESDMQLFAPLVPPSQLMLGSDIMSDPGVPLAPDATLESLAGWVKTNGYGGMMLWTVNSIRSTQL
ncbi:MAG: glycoside hydrolase family 18 protein, partial [Vulcanimicrobiaceae bacterium]